MSAPLANLLRPQKIDDIVGQKHLLGKNKALRKIIESKSIPNMIFYGPSGVGKTTLASIISKETNKALYKLNGTTASTSDIKDIISDIGTFNTQNGILLYLDEIQYLNKKQQQTLLEFIETGKITLIASTTENPYFYVYGAILSRCTVFEFKPVEPKEIKKAIKRAFEIVEKEFNKHIYYNEDVINCISISCSGDVRKSINTVELCVLANNNESDNICIDIETVKQIADKNVIRYDKDGDSHYDILSAFQKSMRGSDPNAAIHYLSRLLEAGDLISACRRLMVCVCEDVGLAYPQAIPIVKSCVDIAFQVGLPEARIPLADAVILVCNSPKSNSAYLAINSAMSDIKSGKIGNIPRHLQNKHCDGEDNPNKGQFYKYPHDYKNSYVKQSYLPKNLENEIYYNFGENKNEQAFKEYWKKIKEK